MLGGFFSPLPVVPHQPATLKGACCGFSLRNNMSLQIQLRRCCGSFCPLVVWLLQARCRQYVALRVPSLRAGSGRSGIQPSRVAWSFFPGAFPHLLGSSWEMLDLPRSFVSSPRSCKTSKVHTTGCCQRNPILVHCK